jgi:ribosomal protein S18 acetylase RimI-like enzyme
MDRRLQYREATTDDLPELQALGLTSYGRYAHRLTPDNWKEWEANFTSDAYFFSLFTNGTCLVCEDNDSIVGMAFLIRSGNPTRFFRSDWCYLRLVAVHPEYENQGIGRQLTNICLAHATAARETRIALHTSEFQDAARHIYESIGFKKHQEYEHYGKKYWVYTLPLNEGQLPAIEYFRATAADIDMIVDQRIAFSNELVGKQEPHTEMLLRGNLTTYFEAELNRNYFCWYARQGTEVAGIGGIGIRVLPGNLRNPSGKWGYIMSMYTVPAYRKLGICTNILERLVATAAGMGITAVELHATPAGEPVYLRHGFIKHSEPTYRKFL